MVYVSETEAEVCVATPVKESSSVWTVLIIEPPIGA